MAWGLSKWSTLRRQPAALGERKQKKFTEPESFTKLVARSYRQSLDAKPEAVRNWTCLE